MTTTRDAEIGQENGENTSLNGGLARADQEPGPAGAENPRDVLKKIALNGVISPHSRRAYGKALDDFLVWVGESEQSFTRAAVHEYRTHLINRQLAPASVNVHIAAIRKLALEASENRLLDPVVAGAIARVKGVSKKGIRVGKWLTREEATKLLLAPDPKTLRGKRDRAVLATLLGCGVRRSELVNLKVEDLQQRDGRTVLPDISGKAGRIRTIPVPSWVETALHIWLDAAGITTGKIFRAVDKAGKARGVELLGATVRAIVKEHADATGVGALAPHDLRRTCAKLCRKGGGDLVQIQLLLGHSSVQTTERYLGEEQELRVAVNDRMGISARQLKASRPVP